MFERSTVKDQDLAESFVDFLERSDEHLSGHCIDEYFKIGGRAKASILELYSALIRLKFQQPALQIEW